MIRSPGSKTEPGLQKNVIQLERQEKQMLQNSHDWLQMLDEENVQFIILDLQSDADLVEIIRLQSKWTVDFEDAELVIFTSAKSTGIY